MVGSCAADWVFEFCLDASLEHNRTCYYCPDIWTHSRLILWNLGPIWSNEPELVKIDVWKSWPPSSGHRWKDSREIKASHASWRSHRPVSSAWSQSKIILKSTTALVFLQFFQETHVLRTETMLAKMNWTTRHKRGLRCCGGSPRLPVRGRKLWIQITMATEAGSG